MANRYWVGNGGNWSDNTNHWSATSGGSPGASLPTSADDVFFNANSFSSTAQTVTIDVSTRDCKSIDFTGVTNSPTLALPFNLDVYGSLTFVSGMTIDPQDGYIRFRATTTGHNINFANHTTVPNLDFNGVGGGWTLQSNFDQENSNQAFYCFVTAGTLNTNGYTVTFNRLDVTGAGTRTLTLGASTVNINVYIDLTGTNITLNANTSTINLLSAATFRGGGKTYNIVHVASDFVDIDNSNTFTTIIIDAGYTVYFHESTTQTVTNFFANSTPSSPITLNSFVSPTAFTLSKASGSVECDYLIIQDSTATGGATWYAGKNSTNVSGNTGWLFRNPPGKGIISLLGVGVGV